MAFPGKSRFGLRLAAGVAAGSLRLYWTGAVMAVMLGIVALSVQVPIRSMARPGHQSQSLLALAPVPAPEAGLAGSAASLEAAGVQTRSVQQLYQLLLILAWAALVIAGISMLTRFTAQASQRGPEIGVRRAAGASRKNLVLSLLGEGVILLAIILAVGLPASALLLRLSVRAWPGMVPGATLLPWAAVLTVGAVLAFGVLAPFRYSTARFMRGGADGQVLLGVPTFQLAVSLTILMGSTALLRRAPVVAAEPAAGPALLLSLESAESNPEERARNVEALLGDLGKTPGIAGVSLTSPGSLLGLGRVDNTTTDCGACVRGQIYIRYDLHTATHYLISPDTFAQQGIRLVSGRGFTDADTWGGQRVAVVSRHLAVSGFESAGAVGRDLFLGDDWPNRPYRVIGVVEDEPRAALGSSLEPLDTIYLSTLQHPPRSAELLVRARDAGVGDSSLAALALSRAGGKWRMRVIGPASAVIATASAPVRWFARWFGVVGFVVLMGALAGTFGTMRMWVESCQAEVAARRSVGATRFRLVAWVLWNTVGVGVKGVLVGLFLYFSVLRVSLTSLVGQLPVWDPATFGALAGLLLAAAVLGAVIPSVGMLRRPIASLFG